MLDTAMATEVVELDEKAEKKLFDKVNKTDSVNLQNLFWNL